MCRCTEGLRARAQVWEGLALRSGKALGEHVLFWSQISGVSDWAGTCLIRFGSCAPVIATVFWLRVLLRT